MATDFLALYEKANLKSLPATDDGNTRLKETSLVNGVIPLRDICRMDERVQRVKTLIESSFDRDLSVTEMARSVDLSVSHLQHLFKSEVGQSPAQYVQELRLMRARDLLESSSLSIKQILFRIGAKDRSSFERRFKRAYKLTPVQFRRVATLQDRLR